MLRSFRKLLALCLEYKPSVLINVIFMTIASSTIAVLSAIMPAYVIGALAEKQSLSAALGIVLAFATVILLARLIYEYIDNRSLYGRIELRSVILLKGMLKHNQTSYPNLLKDEFNGLNEKFNILTSSNQTPPENIWLTLYNLATSSIVFIIFLLFLSKLRWWVILLTTLTTLVGFVYSYKLNKWKQKREPEANELFQKLGYLRQIPGQRALAMDLRLFNLLPWVRELHDKFINLTLDFYAKEQRRFFFADLLDALLTFLRNGIAYIYLIRAVLRGSLEPAEFILFFSILGNFTSHLKGLLDTAIQLVRESVEMDMIFAYLEYPEEFSMAGPEVPAADNYTLELRNVSYSYPGSDQVILDQVNLRIEPGERLAVVGLNGAGKTTLIKLLAGFLEPDSGEVLINGVNIKEYSRRSYYDLFTGVFQEMSILPSSVKDNIVQSAEYDPDLLNEVLAKAGFAERVQSLPQQVNTPITKQVYTSGVELSGGEKQRMLLARALYREAPILLLDEPTAALDPLMEDEIYQKYNELIEDRTAIFISHRLASTRFCDRLILLGKGGILESGTHEELMAKNGKYAELFKVQSRYYQDGDSRAAEATGAEFSAADTADMCLEEVLNNG